ncbi:hypothetical protein [Mucilaginibacter sp. FT3.2]|uniref:hypothetical protein n=1 Tax=Mucilaginibacter sp. FT3.2 TaxID=2723090 RepID=UPI00160FFAF0|nr:hypothetical protein [Mucilaginibacter sp. FT3.2]MBB6231692.1 hypothetical protein [Mucilaginibacter sp. FT3.2]
MAKDFDLPVDTSLLKQLYEGETAIGQFLTAFFSDKSNHSSICQGLASYFYDDGGSPEVREFEITNASFNPGNLTGSFKCVFKVYFFFTCSDVKNQKNENITWQFSINKNKLSIAFVGEEPWVWN